MRGILSLCADYRLCWPFYTSHMRAEKEAEPLCLQHLRVCEVCAYEDLGKKTQPTRAAHGRTHERNSVWFHLPEDTLTCVCSVYVRDARFSGVGSSQRSELQD